MRKRLIIVHSLIVFFSLLVLLLSFSLILNAKNGEASERSLRNYLTVAKKTLSNEMALESDDAAIKDMSESLTTSSQTLRVTVIDLSGNVIIDTFKDGISENHLTRPEIVSLGTICYRYSETLKENMMYLASLDETNQYYIRLAMPGYDISALVNSVVLYGSLALVGVLAISVISDYFLTKKSLAPLREQADKLSAIVGGSSSNKKNDELDDISKDINEADSLIKDKISTLTSEKEKLAFILDSMNQGLIVCNSDLKVSLINKAAKDFFSTSKIEEESSLVKVTIDPKINEAAEKAANEEAEEEIKITKDGRYFLINIYSLHQPWLAKGTRHGVGITLTDITSEYALARSKRDFFANSSHELKSPLTCIIGNAELIKEGVVSSKEEVDSSLDEILSESKRMNEIIIQMLQLSELENQIQEPKENISFGLIIEKLFNDLRSEASKKGVCLKKEGDDFSFLMAPSDASSLLGNLIENGIRYNKENGTVKVKLVPSAREIIVEDNGIGIPKEDFDRIFERFYRVDKAKSKKLGGTGLGLSIVKHIALNYGIEIDVQSKIGNGSSFTLRFPQTKN